MKIDKIIPIWSNIESSYQRTAEPRGLTRLDYLKMLISYKEDTKEHGIATLLQYINEDMQNPECEKYHNDCTFLATILKELSNYIDRVGLPKEIDNLQSFLIEVIQEKDKFTKEMLESYYNPNYINKGAVSSNAVLLPYSRMISDFGCTKSACKLVKSDSRTKSVLPQTYVGYELLSDNFKYLTYDETVEIARSKDFGNDFTLKCVVAYASILSSGEKLVEGYFTSSENIKDGKLFGQEATLIDTIVFNSTKGRSEFPKYKVCDFEVYVVC